MRFFDMCKTGLRNLFRRKMRTALTLSSVAIGAACIIVMISLGIAINVSFQESISQMGSLTMIQIYPNYGGGTQAVMDEDGVAALEKIPHVLAAIGNKWVSGMLLSGKQSGYSNIQAIDFGKLEYYDMEIIEGEIPADVDFTKFVVAGQGMASNFYNGRNPAMSQPVDLMRDDIYLFYETWFDTRKPPKPSTGYKLNVAAVFTAQDEYMMYIDVGLYKKLAAEKAKRDSRSSGGGGGVIWAGSRAVPVQSEQGQNTFVWDNINVKVEDPKYVEAVIGTLKEMGYGTWSPMDMLNEMNSMTSTLRNILGGMGVVALFISAIGIANTMIMAIYERTKEIGIMKVIGARIPDIKRLFLFEASVIGFLGGIVGVGLSVGVSSLLNASGGTLLGFTWMGAAGSKMSIIPLWLFALGLLFSTLVGILSGFYPAQRAATKISALEAIRNE